MVVRLQDLRTVEMPVHLKAEVQLRFSEVATMAMHMVFANSTWSGSRVIEVHGHSNCSTRQSDSVVTLSGTGSISGRVEFGQVTRLRNGARDVRVCGRRGSAGERPAKTNRPNGTIFRGGGGSSLQQEQETRTKKTKQEEDEDEALAEAYTLPHTATLFFAFTGRVQAAAMSEEATQVWTDLESDVAYLTRSARLVQWYPGHIAKAEKALKEQLKLVDVVVEVRDARIPMATTHPEIDLWIGEKKKIVVLNREDMVSKDDKNAWAGYYSSQGLTTLLTDGQRGAGIMKLGRVARSVAADINWKRSQKGLLPRAVRCAVVGYPNVGKSSVINRLLKRSICETAPRPGVTRELRWTRIAEGLDLMDAPGVLPMRIQDQAAATRLAICNDIGEASYAVAGVASVLVEILKKIPTAGSKVLTSRYNIDASDLSGEELLEQLGQLKFQGDVNQAALRVLRDFRKGAFGWVALERPPSVKGSNF